MRTFSKVITESLVVAVLTKFKKITCLFHINFHINHSMMFQVNCLFHVNFHINHSMMFKFFVWNSSLICHISHFRMLQLSNTLNRWSHFTMFKSITKCGLPHRKNDRMVSWGHFIRIDVFWVEPLNSECTLAWHCASIVTIMTTTEVWVFSLAMVLLTSTAWLFPFLLGAVWSNCHSENENLGFWPIWFTFWLWAGSAYRCRIFGSKPSRRRYGHNIYKLCFQIIHPNAKP